MDTCKHVGENVKRTISVVGSTTKDTIIWHDKKVYKIGGVTTYAGFTFQNLGINTIVISNIAKSDRAVSDFFVKNNIQFNNGDALSTTRFVNHYGKGNLVQKMPINAFPVQLNQIKGIFDKVDLIHLGPLHPDDIDMSILKESFQRKKLVSLDIQGYVRRICHGNVTAQVSPCLYDALDCTDYVKAKTGELDLVLKDSGVTLEKLIERHNISEFVVTCGGSGGYIMTEKGKTEFDAHPAHEIMDPTGAGDVFFAAYMVSRLYNKTNIQDSCRVAACLASEQICGDFIPFDSLNLKHDKVFGVQDRF